MSVTLGGVEFDHVDYDRDSDVLYLRVGDPRDAVDFDESPEGHHLRFGPGGRLVGLTIVNARRLLEQEGKIAVTLRQELVDARGLEDVLSPV